MPPKRVKYLEENVESAEIELSSAELDQINEISPNCIAAGDRNREGQIRDWTVE